jgi:hypothetical protein
VNYFDFHLVILHSSQKDGRCSNGVSLIHTEINSDLAPCDFWTFPTMKRQLQGKEFQSDQWSAACFQEAGGAL